MNTELLALAQSGDVNAFHSLFSEFHPQLKSFLYRIIANKSELEDILHDVFLIAFDNVKKFRGDASLKTWVFTIATNHAKQLLRGKKEWSIDTLVKTKEKFYEQREYLEKIDHVHKTSPFGQFDLKEHIDYCSTCIGKMLPIDQQIALILKDIYDFKVKEIALIMEESYGAVKHHLHNARKKMIELFDYNCALVSKTGVCNQCSGLNGKFNPKQNAQEELMKLKLMKEKNREDKKKLYKLRAELVRSINPVDAKGVELHEVFMEVNAIVNS